MKNKNDMNSPNKFEEKVIKDLTRKKEQRLKKELEQTNKFTKISNDFDNNPPLVKKIETNHVPNTTDTKKVVSKKVRFFLSLTSLGLLIFWVINIIDSFERINQIYSIICSTLICIGCLFLVIAGMLTKTKSRSILNTVGCICLLTFASINILVLTNVLKFPTQPVLQDFSNKKVTTAIKWAQKNNITLNTNYEYSDAIKENYVITQDKKGEVLAKNVDELKVIVSQGPNYELEANLPDMVGWDVERVVKKLKELKIDLDKVEIEYNFNEEKKDVLYEQSKTGKIKRNEELNLKFSLGREEDLKPVKLISLKNKTKFDATLWLKRNGIKYEIKYEFNDTIPKGKVIKTDPKDGTTIDQSKMNVILYISKGAKIVAPDLSKMSLDEIIAWASKNNINLNYESEYNSKIKAGDVIRVSVKKGTVIEEGTTITVVTSKGTLKMIDFKNDLNKLRAFAEKNGISLVEKHEFSNTIAEGKIIKVSHKPGQVIKTGESIEIIISNGKVTKVPNFIGMTENEAKKACDNNSLDCTFSKVYSDEKEGTVIDQNKTAGSEVSKNTNVVISISAGSDDDDNYDDYSYSNNSNSYSYSSGSSNRSSSSSSNSSSSSTKTCTKRLTLNMGTGSTGEQTKTMIIGMSSSGIKFSWNMVGSCPNGDTTPGTVCSSSVSDGATVSECDTVYITIIR